MRAKYVLGSRSDVAGTGKCQLFYLMGVTRQTGGFGSEWTSRRETEWIEDRDRPIDHYGGTKRALPACFGSNFCNLSLLFTVLACRLENMRRGGAAGDRCDFWIRLDIEKT